MSVFVRSAVAAALAAGAMLTAAPAAFADDPPPPPPPPNCSVGDMTGIMSGVSASMSAYMFTHPPVNAFFTRQPPPGTMYAARAAAQAAFEELLRAAIDLRGTVTGEHGVGLLKRGGMQRELPLGVRAMQHAVKRALDPLDLFNPGKVIGDDPDF